MNFCNNFNVKFQIISLQGHSKDKISKKYILETWRTNFLLLMKRKRRFDFLFVWDKLWNDENEVEKIEYSSQLWAIICNKRFYNENINLKNKAEKWNSLVNYPVSPHIHTFKKWLSSNPCLFLFSTLLSFWFIFLFQVRGLQVHLYLRIYNYHLQWCSQA